MSKSAVIKCANDEYRTGVRFWILLFERGLGYRCQRLEPIIDATVNLDHKPIRLRVFDLPKMFRDFPIPLKKDYLQIS